MVHRCTGHHIRVTLVSLLKILVTCGLPMSKLIVTVFLYEYWFCVKNTNTFQLPVSSTVNSADKDAYLCLVDQVITSDLPNYQGIRSPLPSVFNLEYIKQEIETYHDKALLDYPTFGFPLRCDKTCVIKNNAQNNHKSANELPMRRRPKGSG